MLKKLNNRGYLLVSLLISISFIGLLISFVFALLMAENNQAKFSDGKKRAYYIARSGADAMASYIINNSKQAESVFQGGESSATKIDNSEDYFVVVANTIPSSLNLMITSDGYSVEQNATYDERVMLQLKHAEQSTGVPTTTITLDYAIYTNNLTIQNPNSLNITSPIIAYGENPTIPSTIPYIYSDKEFIFPDFPQPPTNLTPSTATKPATLQNNYYYTNGLTIDKNMNITQPTVIRTKSLTVEKGSVINIEEQASLKIFIDSGGVFSIKNKSFFNTSLTNGEYVFHDPSKVYIYHSGGANLVIGASYLSAHLYLQDALAATIEKDALYSGNLILDEDDALGATISMENASVINNSVIYAPYSEVSMLNKVTFPGTMVADKLYLNKAAILQQVENTDDIIISRDLMPIVVNTYSKLHYN